jgi:hypothetical protein
MVRSQILTRIVKARSRPMRPDPRGQFEMLFRFYGPEKPLFDKTWKLPDIERITAQRTRRAKP